MDFEMHIAHELSDLVLDIGGKPSQILFDFRASFRLHYMRYVHSAMPFDYSCRQISTAALTAAIAINHRITSTPLDGVPMATSHLFL